MQCKDIPEVPILRFLLQHEGRWCTWRTGYCMPTVQDAMPPGTPERLQQAKMAGLIRRGLVDGCDCGCRGDFEITTKGKAYLQDRNALTKERCKHDAVSYGESHMCTVEILRGTT